MISKAMNRVLVAAPVLRGCVLLRSSPPSRLPRAASHLQQRERPFTVQARQHDASGRSARAAAATISGDQDTGKTSGDDENVDEKSYHLTGRGAGAATRVTARAHTIEMDVPKSMGGKDAAPQPVELLLSALMAGRWRRAARTRHSTSSSVF